MGANALFAYEVGDAVGEGFCLSTSRTRDDEYWSLGGRDRALLFRIEGWVDGHSSRIVALIRDTKSCVPIGIVHCTTWRENCARGVGFAMLLL